jgi:hypothetical protein
MEQSEETFKVKNDEDPKSRVFISLKFRVKSILVFQVLRNQRLEMEFFLSPRHGMVEMNL